VVLEVHDGVKLPIVGCATDPPRPLNDGGIELVEAIPQRGAIVGVVVVAMCSSVVSTAVFAALATDMTPAVTADSITSDSKSML
jgi:hypothetical protein